MCFEDDCSQKEGYLARLGSLSRKLNYFIYSFPVPDDSRLSHFQFQLPSAVLESRGFRLSIFISSSAQWMLIEWMFVRCFTIYTYFDVKYFIYSSQKPCLHHNPGKWTLIKGQSPRSVPLCELSHLIITTPQWGRCTIIISQEHREVRELAQGSHSKQMSEFGYIPRLAGSKDYALYNMLSWLSTIPM